MSSLQKFQAFTLVELIVVIVILAILATISFLSFNSYSSSARDSTRMSNVAMISKGIDMSIALGRGINTQEAGTGMNIRVVGSGGISYTGYYLTIGNKLLSSIQVSGGDILNDSFQKYQLTYIPDNKYYQVLGLLENQLGSSYIENNFNKSENNNINKKKTNISINNLSIIPEVYSSTTSSGFAFIKGNFPVNTASGGYIKGLIPKDYTNAPIINSMPTISGTGDILLPAEIIGSNGGYTDTITEGGGETVALNCSGTTQSGYTITALNDSQSQTFYKSISYGTGSMSATCTNGNLSYSTENISCISGYNVSGSSCVAINPFVACTTKGQTYTGTTTYSDSYGTCDTPDKVVCTGVGVGQVWSMCNIGATTTIGWNTVPAQTPANGTTTLPTNRIQSVQGNYYQWGRNTNVTSTTASAGPVANETNTNFYTSSSDWFITKNDNLWGGATTTSTAGYYSDQTTANQTLMQGPCSTGYHVPTMKEWYDLFVSINPAVTCTATWQNDISIKTTLKLPLAGYRNNSDATYYYQGTYGRYWASSSISPNSYNQYITVSQVSPMSSNVRALGLSIRCLKN